MDKLIQSLGVIEQSHDSASCKHLSMASFIMSIDEKKRPVMLKDYFETMNKNDYKNMMNSFSDSSIPSTHSRSSQVNKEDNIV